MKRVQHHFAVLQRVFLVLALLAAGKTALAQDEFTLAKKGSQAPDFTFETSPGVEANLSDYKGKVILITFFATWCGPCRQELPHIDKEVYQPNRNNPAFILLTFGREHDWKTVNTFRSDQKFTMPLYPDAGRKIFSMFAGQNIPRNFLIGKDGKIRYSSVGFNKQEFAKLKAEIGKALK